MRPVGQYLTKSLTAAQQFKRALTQTSPYRNRLSTLALILLSLAFQVSCSLKKADTETPVPEVQNIEKTMFVSSSKEPKIFAVGLAPEKEVGVYGETALGHGQQLLEHANMSFEITESELIGRLVNPSFPNNPSKWEIALTIPISKHFYYEKSVDPNGRETNEFIENTSRSHWSARPFMKLELSGIRFHKASYEVMWTGMNVHSVFDVEWDKQNGFLGFSLVATDAGAKSALQGQFRINFMQIKNNPEFQRTPFNDRNYRYINVVHVMGEKYDGLKQLLYAGKWDLSKTHQIDLLGFPTDDTLKIGMDVVEDWNKTLEEIGAVKKGHRPFVAKAATRKHAFDLRHTTIYWIDDKRISEFSPLGVGMAISDVRSGEFVWGGVTVYGGVIKEYLHSFNNLDSSDAEPAAYSSSRSQKVKADFMKSLKFPQLLQAQQSLMNSQQLQQLQTPAELRSAYQKIQQEQSQALLRNLNQTELFKVLGIQTSTEDQAANDSSSSIASTKWNEAVRVESYLMRRDWDRNLNQLKPMISGISFKSSTDLEAAYRASVKELLSHEVGHMLGLGHQFKENIIPEQGSVPEKYRQAMIAKATEKAGFTQASSIMGYRHPKTELAAKYEDIGPGPHDKLVLRYIYNQEVPYFKAGDADWTFEKVPASGQIASLSNGRSVSYFPQCNDGDASFGVDPFCNRHDRGATANQLIQNYFADFKTGMIQSLFAMSDARKSDPNAVESALTQRAFTVFGRVRLFYDHMRRVYAKDLEAPSFANNIEKLNSFSRACTIEAGDEDLAKLFASKPDLKELCQANALALEEFRSILTSPLSDFSKLDADNRFSVAAFSGGDVARDQSRLAGTWTEIGAAMIKYAAIQALTTSDPWVVLGGIYTVPNYDSPNFRYSYATLYPNEIIRAVRDVVRSNIFTASSSEQNPHIGRSVLMMGMMMGNLFSSNDTNRGFPSAFFNRLKNQSEFTLTTQAILIEPGALTKDEQHTKTLSASLLDLSTQKPSKVDEVYLLPNGHFIAKAGSNFILPVSQLEVLSDKTLFAFVLKVGYYNDVADTWSSQSVKAALQEMYSAAVSSCILGSEDPKSGKSTGLAEFFNESNTGFNGFYWPKGIASSLEDQKILKQSINAAFDAYYQSPALVNSPASKTACERALKTISMIAGSAGILNGTFTNQLFEALEK